MNAVKDIHSSYGMSLVSARAILEVKQPEFEHFHLYNGRLHGGKGPSREGSRRTRNINVS